MRKIHAVKFHEKFVASGKYVSYQYAQAGETEQWTIHELPDQAWVIRSDIDKEQLGFELVEAWRSPDGKIERMDFHSMRMRTSRQRSNHTQVRASFVFHDNYVDVTCLLDDRVKKSFEIKLPDRYGVALGNSCLWYGFVLTEGSPQETFQIDIVRPVDLFDDYNLMSVRVELFSAYITMFGSDSYSIGDEKYPTASYSLIGENPPRLQIELGPHGIPLAISEGDWNTDAVIWKMEQYAHRPEKL